MTIADAAAKAGVAAAEALLKGLIGKWVSDGKDPQAEAKRLLRVEGIDPEVAAATQELQDLVDAKPSGNPNTGT